MASHGRKKYEERRTAARDGDAVKRLKKAAPSS